jgi:hypothetical protein
MSLVLVAAQFEQVELAQLARHVLLEEEQVPMALLLLLPGDGTAPMPDEPFTPDARAAELLLLLLLDVPPDEMAEVVGPVVNAADLAASRGSCLYSL